MRKGLAVLLSLLVLTGYFLITCQAYGQERITLYTEEGPIPAPVYAGQISEGELNKLGCKYFPDANCPKSRCGVSHYRSEILNVPTKESFDALRSWFYNAMKYEIRQLPPHRIIGMFVGVLALSDWRSYSFGVAEQESDNSPWYIYVVFVLNECGQRALYRMNAGGVVEKIVHPDREVRLVVFQ